jgi:dihydropteroate synthase
MKHAKHAEGPLILRTESGTLDLGRPRVMGILNLTPDSFYTPSRYLEEAEYMMAAEKILNEGADIIDIGAVSTRPGSSGISEKDELIRLLPALTKIRKAFPGVFISVDTYRSEVARQAVSNGADIVNDISGGTMDKNMILTIARLHVPYILMHMQGTPKNMQVNPVYKNVVYAISEFFREQLSALEKVEMNAPVILDPGFGFGKTVDHNFEILAGLKSFKSFGKPVLAGISRKSMVNKVLKILPEEALNGTTALNMLALNNGADILRVHDVKEAKEAVKLFEYYKKQL